MWAEPPIPVLFFPKITWVYFNFLMWLLFVLESCNYWSCHEIPGCKDVPAVGCCLLSGRQWTTPSVGRISRHAAADKLQSSVQLWLRQRDLAFNKKSGNPIVSICMNYFNYAWNSDSTTRTREIVLRLECTHQHKNPATNKMLHMQYTPIEVVETRSK
jgi:hypothetical protein